MTLITLRALRSLGYRELQMEAEAILGALLQQQNSDSF